MEKLLMEVVIGLLVIYAAMALLLTRVQEGVHGGVFRGRVRNMHELLLQACGNSEERKKRVLANPLLLALTKSDVSKPPGWFSRATGPSSVPPDTFVRALLMDLNPTGKAPSTEAMSPLAFMDSIIKGVKPTDAAEYGYLNGLRALIPSAESNWPAFETALALWFSDIGDRASGWYKRNSSVVGLWIAFGLCAAMNVDTHNIINTLGADNELRQGLGNMADLFVQARGEDQGKVPAQPEKPVDDPATRAVARLVDANARISEAYNKDKAITRFGYYVTEADEVCKGVPLSKSAVDEEGKYISNADTWVGLLPSLLPRIEKAVNRIEETADVPKELRETYICLSNISAWVRAASTASNNVDTRRVMLEAGVALEESKSALVQLLRNSELRGGLRRLFRLDPEAFVRCATRASASSANMQDCVQREQDLLSRLPVGHTGANRRQQFCEILAQDDRDADERHRATLPPIAVTAAPTSVVSVAVETQPKEAAREETSPIDKKGGWSRFVCGSVVLQAQPRLGTGSMTLVFDPWSILSWFLGLLISALFISLGAPILFDTLARWVKIRNAGDVRDAAKDARKGAGTMTLPMLAAGGSAAVAASVPAEVSATKPGVLAANEGAVGDFEEQLTERELQSVKQRLGIQPSTGGFDETTRDEIQKATGARRLTLASYTLLMGRPPLQAGPVNGALPGSAVLRGKLFDGAAKLGAALCTRLFFASRIPNDETRFTDELRALTVLYRYKSGADLTHTAPVFGLADTDPAKLDSVDDSLRIEMLDATRQPLVRTDTAPWMDVALGELGQTELKGTTRATSNTRICEYLDAAAPHLGDSGDNTPWCGAFVSWVLGHPYAAGPTNLAPAVPPNGATLQATIPQAPARALNWASWARPAGLPAPAAADTWQVNVAGVPRTLTKGDVVVVDVSGNGRNHHVGFVFEVVGNTLWMLGGNQFGGTRVCLSPWRIGSIC